MSEIRVRLIVDDAGFAPTVDRSAARLGSLKSAADAAGTSGARSFSQMIGRSRELEFSAKQTDAALRQLPAQFTDIFTSLQAGQNPLTVFLQQGGQIRDQFGGAVPALKAMAATAAGAITPVTLLGAAALTVGVGFLKGRAEISEYTKTLTLTGNPLGLTTDALIDMANAIDAVGRGATRGQAAEVLNQLAATGDVGAANLQRFAQAAIELENAGGPAASETAKAFAALAKDPAQAVLKLNENTRFLTAAVFEQIQALQSQGRTTEAARVAQEAYAQAIEQRTPQLAERLGYVERAWVAIKEVTREAGDAITSIGVPPTLDDDLRKVEERLLRIKAARTGGILPAGPAGVGRNLLSAAAETTQAEKEGLELEKRYRAERASANAEEQRQHEQAIKRSVARNDLLKQYADRTAQLNAELKKARDSFAGLTDADSLKNLARLEKEINERFKPPRAPQDKQANRADELISTVAKAAAAKRLEVAEEQKLTESQRLGVQVAEELRAGKIKLTAAQDARIKTLLAEIAAGEQLIDQRAREQKWLEETTAANTARLDGMDRETAALREQIRQQTEANIQLGATGDAYQLLTRMRLENNAAMLDERAAQAELNFDAEGAKRLREQAAAYRELAQARQAGDVLRGQNAERDQAKELFDKAMGLNIGADLAAGFDKASQSLGTFVRSFKGLLEAQHAYNDAILAGQQDPAKLEKLREQSAKAQIRSYGDMAGAAKGFFSEGSRGYKAMAAAEKAFRATELANAIASHSTQLAQIGARVAAFVTGNTAIAASDTARAGVEQGNSLATAAIKGTEAVVNAIRSLPFPLNLAAGTATAAAVAALGVRVAGSVSGGGGGLAGFNAGQGSVLGDSAAGSKSIEKSIQALNGVNTLTMRYSAQMAASLRNIEGNIGGVATLLARTGGVQATGQGVSPGYGRPSDLGGGFLFDVGSALGRVPLIGGVLEGLAQRLFGSTQKITGQGVFAGPQTVSSIASRGFDASYFSNVETTDRFLGIKTGSSTEARFSDAGPEFERQITLLVGQFTGAIEAAAGPLGQSVASLRQRLSDEVVNIGAIDLQGLTGEQQRERLTQVFGKLGDDLAKAALPGLAEFQRVGEGYLETVVRVAAGTEQADQALRNLGVLSVGRFSSFVNRQAEDIGAEVVRSSLYWREVWTGFKDGMGEIVLALDGSVSEIASTYRQLVDARAMVQTLGLGRDVSSDLLAGAGGLDELASSLSAFEDLVLTDAEKYSAARDRLAAEFDRFGQAMPQTVAGFAALVRGIDTSTEAGRVLQGQLLGLTEGFASLQDMAQSAGQAIRSAQDIAAERDALLRRSYEILGDTVRLRELELAALDPSNRALQEWIWTLERQAEATRVAQSLTERLADLRYGEQAQRERTLAGMDEFTASLQRQVWAMEDGQRVYQERRALDERLAVAMGGTNAAREIEISKLDATNQAVLRTIYAMEDAAKAAEAAAQQAAAVAQERASLERTLWELQGDTASMRAAELAALAPGNQALQLRIYALQDEAAAADVARAIAQERAGLERQLMELQGNTAGLRAAEVAALNPLNQALQWQIYTLQDAQKAAEAAAQAAERVQQERQDLERQYLELIGDTAGLRAMELASIDPANRALQERIWALQDEKKAADELVSAGRGIVDWINELRGMPGSGTSEGLRSTYLADLAAASAGDAAANSRVVSSAKSLVDSLRQSAANPIELARETSLIATQLAGLPAAQAATRAAQPLLPASVPAGYVAAMPANSGQASDQQPLLAELQALRREVEQLRAEQRDRGDAIVTATRRTATVLTNVTSSGNQVSITAG